MAEDSTQTVEILGPDEGKSREMPMLVAESFGIQIKAVSRPGEFTYEMKIPLHASTSFPYAIPAENDSLVAVTFETFDPGIAEGLHHVGGMPEESEGADNMGMSTNPGQRSGGGHHHEHRSSSEPRVRAQQVTMQLQLRLVH